MSNGIMRAPSSAREAEHSIALTRRDIAAGWRRRELWWLLSYQDIAAAYQRSTLGPFWITLQMTVFSLGIALVYAGLFGQTLTTFIPLVAVGFLVWNLMSGLIMGATTCFIGNSGFIRASAMPLSVYAFKTTAGQVWLLLHNLVPVTILLLLVRVTPSPWALITTPVGLLAVILNGFLLIMWLGPMAARFRDIGPLVESAMRLLMFLTPVFWDPTQLPSRAYIAWNPLAYFLEAIRAPLLGEPIRPVVWVVILAMTLVNGLAALVVFGRNRRWIPYWVS